MNSEKVISKNRQVSYESCRFLEKPNDLDAAVKNRKKVVANLSRREGVYNRAGNESVPFCEKGGAAA